MPDALTIGEIAAAAGVLASTVRFYERRGLIQPEGRSEANYRLFSQASLERLRFIVAAKDAGFALSDIRALLDFADGQRAPCKEVQTLIEDRLARTRDQMERLKQVDERLTAWLGACKRAERRGACEVVDRLRNGSNPPRKKSRSGA